MRKRFIKNIISIIILMLFCEGQIPHHHHIANEDGSYNTFFSTHSTTQSNKNTVTFVCSPDNIVQNILDVTTRKFNSLIQFFITPIGSKLFVTVKNIIQVFSTYISFRVEADYFNLLFSRPPPLV